MPKTNSDSDFGGSITSSENDIDAGPSSPVATHHINGEISMPTKALSSKLDRDVVDYVKSHTLHPDSGTKIVSSARSVSSRKHSLIPGNHDGDSSKPKLRGLPLFRASAHKIMRMRQLSLMMGMDRGAGAEPGVDPRRASAFTTYGHLREKCAIRVVDYSSLRSKFQEFNNEEFIQFLESGQNEKEPWAKVRWISIGGISWDVLSQLSLTYDLHPLSLEDVLHHRSGHFRSKADYFSRYLFLRVLCHSLGNSDAVYGVSTALHAAPTIPIMSLPRSYSPSNLPLGKQFSGSRDIEPSRGEYNTDVLKEEHKQFGMFHRNQRTPYISGARNKKKNYKWSPATSKAQARAQIILNELKAGARVNVVLEKLFIFLLRDGTVISIHETAAPDFPQPILTRLRTSATVLRSTADASLLVESILDLVVDRAVHVIEEYKTRIHQIECNVMLKPDMNSVRHLHILSGDLSLHKSTMEPIKSLIYGLRRYDLDRCIAITDATASRENDVPSKTVGFMSHKAKVYLADVHDHVEYIITSLEIFAGISENLINYTFNMASYEMNQVMRRLTLATIIFLPLTLLTGYFGMNFTFMWSVKHNHSDIIFWEIAIPLMLVIVPLFLWSDIMALKNFLEKKMNIQNALKRHMRSEPELQFTQLL